MNNRSMEMKRSIRTSKLGLSFAILTLVAVGLFQAGCRGNQSREWVIALRPDKDADAMLEERKFLEAFLSESLGDSVQVIVPTSSMVIEQGLANGTIDAAWVSSTSMAQFRKRNSAEVLLVGTVDGNRYYSSYWVTLNAKHYQSVEELRGKRVGFASPSSTSGYIIPVFDLYQRGLITLSGGASEFFGEGNVEFGTGYVSVVQRVLSGHIEAAAVSDYVLDGDKHLSESQRSKLKIVQKQGPVPTHCIAVRSGLNSEDVESLRTALVSLGQSNRKLSERLFGSPLEQTDADAHLLTIVQALEFVEEMRGR